MLKPPRPHLRPFSAPSPAGFLATLAGATLALGLLGCDNSKDESSAALRKARNTLVVASAGGSAAAPASVRNKAFDDAASSLNGLPSEGPQGAIVQGLSAVVVLGQADRAVAQYRLAGAEVTRRIETAASLLDLLQSQRGLAESLKGYDPKPDIERLDLTLRERRGEMTKAQENLAGIKQEVADLRAKAQAALDEVQPVREQRAQLAEQMLSANTASRAQLSEQIRQLQRQIDVAASRSEGLLAQAARVEPLSIERALEIKRIEQQVEALEAAKLRASAYAGSLNEQSVAAAAEARKAEGLLATAIQDVRASFTDPFVPAYSDALGKLSTAARQASAARGSGTSQQASAASIAHSSASLRREHAEAIARYAGLLRAASGLTPAIPGIDGVDSELTALEEQRATLVQEAIALYEQARDGLASGGGDEARGAALTEQLNKTIRALGGGEPEGGKDDAPAPASETPATEEAPAAPQDQPAPAEDAAPAQDQPETPAQEPADAAPAEPSAAPGGTRGGR